MDTHYSAFISYKHAPADIAVAEEIQKRLERYHIPGPIRKKTGRDKIGRIFRDKEELPITSDLGDDISRALEDADFLIVICSTATKTSTWVPREIACFLKNHTKKQILTVLVDGEPNDVIPGQLLTDKVEKLAQDGSAFEEDVVYEPLSCDFRAGIKESRRTEIPRLAAALLGCSYDELVMRERQYHRRRALAIGIPIACAVFAAMAYLIWSRQEIAKNYQKALINQSNILSSEAADLLEGGDRLRAILLSLEALPSEGNDRPLTANAQNQLAKALHVYTPLGTSDANQVTTAVAEFQTPGVIEEFELTTDDRYLVVRDSYHMVHVWDVREHEKVLEAGSRVALDSNEAGEAKETGDGSAGLKSIPLGEVQDVEILSNTGCVVLTDSGVSAIDFTTGEILWTFSEDGVSWEHSAMCVSGGEAVFLAEMKQTNLKDDNGDTIYDISGSMAALDVKTGEVIDRADFEAMRGNFMTMDWVRTSSDGQTACVAMHETVSETPRMIIWRRDKKQADWFEKDTDKAKIQTACFLDSHRMAVMSWIKNDGKSTDANPLNTITAPKKIRVTCYDLNTDSVTWETGFESPQVHKMDEGRGFAQTGDESYLIAFYANKTVVIDTADGHIRDEVECTDSMINAFINNKDHLMMPLTSGMVSVYTPEEAGYVANFPYFDFSLLRMVSIHDKDEVGSDFLAQPDEHRIWLCGRVYDEEFTAFEGDPLPADTARADCVVTGHALFYRGLEGSMMIYDTDSGALKTSFKLKGDPKHYWYLGADTDQDRLWYYYFDDYKTPDYLVSVNAAGEPEIRYELRQAASVETYMLVYICLSNEMTGSVDWLSRVYPDALMMFGAGRTAPLRLADGRFVWMDKDDLCTGHIEDNRIVTDKTVKTGELPVRWYLSPDESKVVMFDAGMTGIMAAIDEKGIKNVSDDDMTKKQHLYIVSLDSGEKAELPAVLYHDPALVVWSDDSWYAAVTDGEEAALYSADGEVIRRFSETGHRINSMSTHGDELIILYTGGLLTRYRWSDGKFTGQSMITHYGTRIENYGTPDSFTQKYTWQFLGDKLYLICRDSYSLLNVIDLKEWAEELSTTYVFCYDAARDRFISTTKDRGSGETYLGWYRHYTLDELREKAYETLRGMTLSDEERVRYGLNVS